jgi:hypothetical protein
MRPDMAKVIVERPRYNSRAGQVKGYARRWARIELEDSPRRESIGRRGGRTKQFNEHLGPLRRYLRRQLGRPWNKVFSEICRHIRLDSAVQSHVRDHVSDIVATDVIVWNGVLCIPSGYPLRKSGWMELYVCPRTGLLREIKSPKRSPLASDPDWVRVDDTRGYRRFNGVWYEVFFSPLSAATEGDLDIVMQRRVYPVDRWLCATTHGAPVYASGRRQLNKREIRRLALNGSRQASR